MKKIFILAFCVALAACSTVTVRNSNKMPPVRPTETQSNRFFIGGIGQESIIDAEEICDGRGFSIKSYYSFLDGFIATITFGIYTPSTTEIFCDRLR